MPKLTVKRHMLQSPLRSLVSLVLVTFLLRSPSVGQDGLQLFHRMQRALGGAEKIASVRDFEEIVRAQTWNQAGDAIGVVRKRARWISPNYLRLDQVGPGDTYVLYFDGTGGWEILPDKTVANLEAGELQFAQKYLRDFRLHAWLSDRDTRFQITSPASNVIRIADGTDPTHQLEIALDPVTSLPISETTVSLADPAHPLKSEVRIEEWQTVGGIRFPHRTVTYRNGTVRVAEITVEDTRLNKGIKPADLAVKPTDLKPVMSPQ
jgi:hypothetical protein